MATVLMATMSLPLFAQSEGGLIAGAEVEKKVNKKLSVGIEAEMRTRHDFKTMDRWKFGIGASYKLTPWLKANAGYDLLNSNFREKISYKSSGDYNHWRPSYWGIKHRLHFSLTGSYKFSNNIKLSLRERWQYTYRPEKTVDQRWDCLNNTYDGKQKIYSGKGRNVLRSRLQVEYDKKGLAITPYANVELFNAWSLQKIRYNVGVDWKLSKQHSLGFFYRYQHVNNDEDDLEPNIHMLGLGYKFKF